MCSQEDGPSCQTDVNTVEDTLNPTFPHFSEVSSISSIVNSSQLLPLTHEGRQLGVHHQGEEGRTQSLVQGSPKEIVFLL